MEQQLLTFRLKHYEAAVELNNIAVLLCEKQAYKESIDTLDEAINMMKNVVYPGNSAEAQSEALGESDVEVGIIKAHMRMFSMLQTSQVEDIHTLAPDYSHSILTTNSPPSREIQEHAYNTPFRINTSGRTGTKDCCDLYMVSALMIYNLAILHKIVAVQGQQAHFLQSSIKLLTMAHDILSDTKVDIHNEWIHRRVWLLVKILNSLVEMKLIVGQQQEAAEYYRKLLRISEAIARQAALAEFIEETSGAAAA